MLRGYPQPVHGAVSDRFALVYGPAPEEESEIALTADESAFEPLDGNSIDIGEAVAQELSLALPIYPRDPEARIDQAAIAEPLQGPFARWRGCARMLGVEMLDKPLTGAPPASVGQFHHSCRRLGFWLITHLGSAHPPNHRASHGRSQKENSPSRRNMRRSHHALKPAAFAECPNCGELKRPHRLCESSGYYDGREVTKAASEAG